MQGPFSCALLVSSFRRGREEIDSYDRYGGVGRYYTVEETELRDIDAIYEQFLGFLGNIGCLMVLKTYFPNANHTKPYFAEWSIRGIHEQELRTRDILESKRYINIESHAMNTGEQSGAYGC